MTPSLIDKARTIAHREGIIGLVRHVVRWPLNGVYHEPARILSFTLLDKEAIPAARIPVTCELVTRQLLVDYAEADQWKQSLEALEELSRMGCLFFGARHNRKLVAGFYMERKQSKVFSVKISLPDHSVHIRRAFTLSEFRGKGIMPMLLTYAVHALANSDVTRILVVINTTNMASMRSFRRAGFSIAGSIGFMDGCGLRLVYCTAPKVIGMKYPMLLRRIKTL